ncbi:MAG: hypothetical protein EPO10_06455, partial [Reyranella sp.]
MPLGDLVADGIAKLGRCVLHDELGDTRLHPDIVAGGGECCGRGKRRRKGRCELAVIGIGHRRDDARPVRRGLTHHHQVDLRRGRAVAEVATHFGDVEGELAGGDGRRAAPLVDRREECAAGRHEAVGDRDIEEVGRCRRSAGGEARPLQRSRAVADLVHRCARRGRPAVGGRRHQGVAARHVAGRDIQRTRVGSEEVGKPRRRDRTGAHRLAHAREQERRRRRLPRRGAARDPEVLAGRAARQPHIGRAVVGQKVPRRRQLVEVADVGLQRLDQRVIALFRRRVADAAHRVPSHDLGELLHRHGDQVQPRLDHLGVVAALVGKHRRLRVGHRSHDGEFGARGDRGAGERIGHAAARSRPDSRHAVFAGGQGGLDIVGIGVDDREVRRLQDREGVGEDGRRGVAVVDHLVGRGREGHGSGSGFESGDDGDEGRGQRVGLAHEDPALCIPRRIDQHPLVPGGEHRRIARLLGRPLLDVDEAVGRGPGAEAARVLHPEHHFADDLLAPLQGRRPGLDVQRLQIAGVGQARHHPAAGAGQGHLPVRDRGRRLHGAVGEDGD